MAEAPDAPTDQVAGDAEKVAAYADATLSPEARAAAISASLPRREVDLFDLHRDGAMSEFSVEIGGEVRTAQVWIERLTPDEHERCVRHGARAKAGVLAKIADEGAEEWQVAIGELIEAVGANVYVGADDDDTGDEQMVAKRLAEVAGMVEIATARDEAEARILEDAPDEDEGHEGSRWAKDGYVVALMDEWLHGAQATWVQCPEPDENAEPDQIRAYHVFQQLIEFLADVQRVRDEAAEEVINKLVAEHSVDVLRRKAAQVYLENRAQEMWMREFHRWRIYYSVRLPDQEDVRYFDRKGRTVAKLDAAGRPMFDEDTGAPLTEVIYGRDAIETLDETVLGQLIAGYERMSISRAEGNGSPPPLTSSPPRRRSEEVASMLSGQPARPS